MIRQFRLKSLLVVIICIGLCLGAYHSGYRSARVDSRRERAEAIRRLQATYVETHVEATEGILDRLISDGRYATAYMVAKSLERSSREDSIRLRELCRTVVVDRFNELMEAERYDDALAITHALREFPDIPELEPMRRKARIGCEMQRLGPTDGIIRPLAWRAP
jgi:hypothetical protein